MGRGSQPREEDDELNRQIQPDLELDPAPRVQEQPAIEGSPEREGPWCGTAESVANRHLREREERARQERARFDLD